jgi:hypothetical protein
MEQKSFYELLPRTVREGLVVALPDCVCKVLPTLINALQAMGEEADALGKTEDYTLADFLLWAGLDSDNEDDIDEDEPDDDEDDDEDENEDDDEE